MISEFSQIPAALLARSPDAIAKSLASKETFPDGPGVGMRMLTFYISYGGKHLSASRRRNLERAKKLLAARVERMLKEERQQAA
jgi:tRNA(adenine34) deaminase